MEKMESVPLGVSTYGLDSRFRGNDGIGWIPAFAGMTEWRVYDMR